MLDLVGITFSGIMMLLIVIRAIQLNMTRPWFETAPPEQTAEATAAEQAKRSSRRPPWTPRPAVRPPSARGTRQS